MILRYANSMTDYKFELEPLPFDEFIGAIDEGLLKCIVLLENNIPTAFLAYTCAISEAVELNIIHCLGDEDLDTKRRVLIDKFMELTENYRREKIVCYPMIGSQGDFAPSIAHYGFKFVGIAVMRFVMSNPSSERILETAKLSDKSEEYSIVKWSDEYYRDALKSIHQSFEHAQDALFDPRFKTENGVRDILDKITQNIYGEFLPDATSVLLYNGKPCGYAFANVTGGKVANIPLVAIDKEHRGKGLSEHLLKRTVQTIFDWNKLGERLFSEVNVSTETNNYQALRMYRSVGFKEDYNYPQAYLLVE